MGLLRSCRMLFAVVAAGVVLTMTPGSPATAAWSASGTGSASGAATVMPIGLAPTANAASDVVTVQWAAAVFPSGTPVAGYVVSRTNTLTGTKTAAGGTCAGVVAATTCADGPVPAGSWSYSDTPVQMSWTGGASPPSASVVVA
jgi:hypothetical protein